MHQADPESKAGPERSFGFRRRVFLARAAFGFETLWMAIWPALAVLALFLIVSLFGLWLTLPAWLHGLGLVGFAAAAGWSLWRAWRAFAWPDRAAGLRRLERVNRLNHQPLRSLGDRLSGGREDPATSSLWRRHQERLLRSLRNLRVGPPRSDLPRRDPWALRAAILLVLIVALVEARDLAPHRLAQAFDLGRGAPAVEQPVAFTVWITPPAYTGRPPVSLEAEPSGGEGPVVVRMPGSLELPTGSQALAQLHHLRAEAEGFGLSLDERRQAFAAVGGDSAEASLLIDRSGELRIASEDEQLGAWQVEALPDLPPEIAFAGEPGATHRAVLRTEFEASDDYGVDSISLLMSRPGEDGDPERIELARPSASATEVADAAYTDLTPHPWAGLPVVLRLEAVDGIEQRGVSEEIEVVLPARQFQHPVARAVIEQRRKLADRPERRDEVAQALDRLSRMPSLFREDISVFLALSSAAQRLLRSQDIDEDLDDILETLWETALHLEDGGLSLAERDLRSLQEQLQEALERGASDEELERLMDELERALQAYLEELAQQARDMAEQGQELPTVDPDAMQLQTQDLQEMLDQIREMMRSGAREAAQQMLAQLQEMLENMQMAQSGQAQQGQQSMSQLQEMIQRQQELLDRTFGLSRQQQGQQGEQGQQGQQGQMGQQGARPGERGEGMSGSMGQTAAEQEALRRALGELMQALGDAGMQIPRALGEAELEMRGARDALQQGQPGDALDPQAQALDQLRQGGQAMMQEMQRMYGQGQGQMPAQQWGEAPSDRDPLGRSMYNQGGADLWGERVPSELELGRARAIMEELYRRSGQRHRPMEELDYLQRLLRRF